MGCGCSTAQKGAKESEGFGETSNTKSFDKSFTDIGHVQIILDNDKDKDKEEFIKALDNNELLEKLSSLRFAVTAKKEKLPKFEQLDNDFLSIGDNLQTHRSKSDSNLVERLSSRRFAVSAEVFKDVPNQYVKPDNFPPSVKKAEPSLDNNNELLEKLSSLRFAVISKKVKLSEFEQLDNDFQSLGDNLQIHYSKSDSNLLVERLSSPRLSCSAEASKPDNFPPSFEKAKSSTQQYEEAKMDLLREKLELVPLKSFEGVSSEDIFSPAHSFKKLKQQKDIVDAIPSLTSQDDILERYDKYHKKLSVVPEVPSPRQSANLNRYHDDVKEKKDRFLAIETYATITSYHIMRQALDAMIPT